MKKINRTNSRFPEQLFFKINTPLLNIEKRGLLK